MRADRLVAIVLLLQARGRMTVSELAERLETSARTVRRDLDALSLAGVPVYAQRGRGGGWDLLGGHRIDLSGLTVAEAQALLLAIDPGAAGLADALAAARRKVLAAMPAPLRARAEAAQATVLVDPSRWGRNDAREPGDEAEAAHLGTLREAVLAGVRVVVDYEPPGRPAEERQLQPRGLVCKHGVWYLVATAPSGLRTYRLSRVRSVTVTEEPVEPAPDFRLDEAWAGIEAGILSRTPAPLVVDAEVSPASLRRLRATVGAWWPVEEAGHGAGGSVRVRLRFPSVETAVAELVGLGDGTFVRAPVEVRAALAESGRRLVARYAASVDR